MEFLPGQLYHVYNRGNNRERVFFTPGHYLFFLRKLRRHILPHSQVLAYCLMPNHFHLLLYVPPEAPVATQSFPRFAPLVQGIGTLLSSYTQAINKEYSRTGSLFQAKTKALCLADGLRPATCLHYIHQNPWRAGLAATLADWPYSSYRDYAGLRSGTLCHQELARELLDLPGTPTALVHESAQALDLGLIRQRFYGTPPVGRP